MSTDQKTARLFGALFLLTFLTSIPALGLFQPVLDDPAGYIKGAGQDNRIFFGATLELLLIIANVGTAVVLLPIARRKNEMLAAGFLTARIMESVFIAIGIICVLGIVSLRKDHADAAALAVSLADLKDWTFLLGPGFVVGWGNGLVLGFLMYRSGLMPRNLAVLGLIGGPLLILSGVGALFGVIDKGGTAQAAATIPEILWELSLCFYPLVRGFRPQAIAPIDVRGESLPAPTPA